jgi:hypothetical protein
MTHRPDASTITDDQLDELYTRAEQAEAALAVLHQGEEPHLDERIAPTPAQWIWRWNRATLAERLDVAGRVIHGGTTADRCFLENHPARLADLQQRYDDEHATAVTRAQETDRVRRQLAAAEARIAAVRSTVQGWRHLGGIQWAIDRILADLDGPKPPLACPRCQDRKIVPDWSNWDAHHGEPKPKPCPDCALDGPADTPAAS